MAAERIVNAPAASVVGRDEPWSLLKAILNPAFPCPGPYARLVFLALWGYANRDGQSCYPAQFRLSRDLGIGERQVRRALDQLRDAGLVTWKQIGGRFNSYSLSPVWVPALPTVALLEPHRPHSPATPAPQSGHTGPTVQPHRPGGPLTPDSQTDNPTHYQEQDRPQEPVGAEPGKPGRQSQGRAGSSRKPGNPDVARLIKHYHDEFLRLHGTKPVIRGEVAGAAALQLLAGRSFEGADGAAAIVTTFLQSPPPWNEEKGLLRLEDIPRVATEVLMRLRRRSVGGGQPVQRDSSGAPLAAPTGTVIEDVLEEGRWVRVTKDATTGEVIRRRDRGAVSEGGTDAQRTH